MCSSTSGSCRVLSEKGGKSTNGSLAVGAKGRGGLALRQPVGQRLIEVYPRLARQ